jgi:ubiquitin carboxyl-terminal hydrolase 25/28
MSYCFPNALGLRHHSSPTLKRTVVSHLRLLYTQLIHAEVSSIYPERELAYLALVSSKDADDGAKEGVLGRELSSGSTDATLVDEPGPLAPPASDQQPQTGSVTPPTQLQKAESASSILGKRHYTESGDFTRAPLAGRDPNRDTSPSLPPRAQTMPIPETDKETSRPRRRTLTQDMQSDSIAVFGPEPAPAPNGDLTEETAERSDEPSGNDRKAAGQPPPLPPRKRPQQPAPQSSYMMFGAIDRNFWVLV